METQLLVTSVRENNGALVVERRLFFLSESELVEFRKKTNWVKDEKGRFAGSVPTGGSGGNSGLTNEIDRDIMDLGSDDVTLEYQRYGRNKETLINKSYIESGEYKRKFDNATDNPELNKSLYDAAKTALKHRSGTELEDMYWFDGKTGKLIACETDSTDNRCVRYSASTKQAVNSRSDIVALHTHPSSMPPSIEDFNSCCSNSYKVGFVACHNGKVFGYSSEQKISPKLYELRIGEYLQRGLSEFDAQMKTLEDLKLNHKIDFWEVK